MDNEYNQPGGYPPQYPAGQTPQGYPQGGGQDTQYPQNAYGSQGGYADPYGAQPGYTNAAEGYGTTAQYPSMDGYGQAVNQQPYADQGTYQQPYADPGAYQQPYEDPGMYQQPYSQDGYQHLFGQQPQEQAPAGFPPVAHKPVRQRRRLTASDIALIVVALLAVAGFAFWFLYTTYAPSGANYGEISLGSLSASHEGDCLIVRDESPFSHAGVTSISYVAEEGSNVIRGGQICKVYSSGYSKTAVRTLQGYRSEIRDYQKELIREDALYDTKMAKLEDELLIRVREARNIIGGADGSLTNQEVLLTQAVATRQQNLEQKYTTDHDYARLFDDERQQTQKIDSWTKTYTAKAPGIVSFYSDGYEYGLTVENYMTFEPDEVRGMINGDKPELSTTQKGKTTIYRMINDGTWYVLFLADNTSWDPVNGQIYELSLDRFEDTVVTAEVVSFTRSGGELLLRLKINSPVDPVLYMRTCEAVLGENVSTLKANSRAIHEQDGMVGVVVVEGSTESFIPIEVLYEDDNEVYFQPIQQNMLFEGMTVRLF